MTKILFLQGAGDGAHKEDAVLAANLGKQLGQNYDVICPAMPNEGDPEYKDWKAVIQKQLSDTEEPVVIVGHSIGGNMALKFLADVGARKQVAALVLMAVPFWGGDGWRYEGYQKLELPQDIATQLGALPVFIYHCQDDFSVPHEHVSLFESLLPNAKVQHVQEGGHQFEGEALGVVVKDIQALKIPASH